MKRAQIYVTVVLLFLGMMVAVQIRSTRKIQQNVPSNRVQELTSRLQETKEERDTLRVRVEDLRKKLDQASSGQGGANQAIRDELDKARMEAGLVAVKGQGVQVTLNDSPKELQPGENPNLFILHEEDLLKVVNELKAGGAEAISVNEQRLLATSEIRCAGNTILVNTRKIVPPIVIDATGDPNTLSSGLQIKGGIFDSLKAWGLVADVRKMDGLTIPAYSGPITFSFSKPVK
ncbi:MAG: DUF881 domain-containing protein [Eubacteriales bacterium]